MRNVRFDIFTFKLPNFILSKFCSALSAYFMLVVEKISSFINE